MKPYFSVVFLFSILAVSYCLPTSVLANTKDSSPGQKNFKVKRSSDEKPIPLIHQQENSDNHLNNKNGGSQQATVKPNNLKETTNHNEKLKSGNDVSHPIPDPIISGLFMNSMMKEKPAPHKRGVSSQFLYGNPNNNNNEYGRNYPTYIPNGIWSNELDPSGSIDFQDFDEYPRAQYVTQHNKPYDSLQNILNSEPMQYQNPLALPYQYGSSSNSGYGRYYNDRRKRSNKQHSSYDDSGPEYTELELTPNELLALLAMIEAGAMEKYQPETDVYGWDKLSGNQDYAPYGRQNYYDDHDEIGSFFVPNNNKMNDDDFDSRYQIPINLENIPRYEVYRDSKGSRGQQQAKRFMVSKKKRSLGYYLNGNYAKPGLSFSPMKGAKSIQKVV